MRHACGVRGGKRKRCECGGCTSEPFWPQNTYASRSEWGGLSLHPAAAQFAALQMKFGTRAVSRAHAGAECRSNKIVGPEN